MIGKAVGEEVSKKAKIKGQAAWTKEKVSSQN